MSDVIEVELDELNRILISPDLRQRLGLAPGMTLIVEEDRSGRVALHIQPESAQLIDKGGILVASVELLDDIAEAVGQERERQALDPAQRAHM
jgi:bifunctional DNA-binding transcriptional regulator/antitoxin component of YhaV-PrlF toxin-antitoxin module